jgi:hypothetical protein
MTWIKNYIFSDIIRRATLGWADYMQSHFNQMTDVTEIAHLILRAFSDAHNRIVEGKDSVWEAGTTTLVGGKHSFFFFVFSPSFCTGVYLYIR